MNERIELLLMKAIQESNSAVKNETYEKFAELIVKECVSVGSTAFYNDHSVLPIFPSEQIKEHFGVKQ